MRAKKQGLSRIKKKAWTEYSRYIRLKYADKNGYVMCITCGTIKHWKKLQAGHLLDGRCNSILFEEAITFPQCYGCNCMKSGNKEVFIPWFIDTYGRDFYEKMRRQKNKTVKFSYSDLEEKYEHYKKLAKELEDEKTSL